MATKCGRQVLGGDSLTQGGCIKMKALVYMAHSPHGTIPKCSQFLMIINGYVSSSIHYYSPFHNITILMYIGELIIFLRELDIVH